VLAGPDEQVLDGLTLGDIWSGSIVWWNDTAIQNLNPTATMPQTRIRLVYANDTLASISGAFGDALAIFNPNFAALWSASNQTLFKVVETIDNAINIGEPGAQQPITVKATPYSLGYSTLPIANANGATSARMKNKAGAPTRDPLSCCHSELKLASWSPCPCLCITCAHETGSVVSPTSAAVQSAASEVTNKLTSSFLSPDIFNGNLSTSWPLCLTNYISLFQSKNTSDCSHIEHLLAFVAWSQLNPHTFSKVQDLGYSPLPFGFKTYPLPSPLTLRACNGASQRGI
jgi:ABC-type phosphate transport system substrate-binding protein